MRLYQKRSLEVFDAIRALPSKDRPNTVRHMLDLCLAHLDWNTNVVNLTRDELAELMGVPVRRVSEAANVLERLGAITRQPMVVNGHKTVWVEYRVATDLAGKGQIASRKPAAGNVVALRQPA